MSRVAPFLGLGTGRCGTKSLAEIVGGCESATVAHEHYQSGWYEEDDSLDALCRDMNAYAMNGILFGEVNSHLLPHVAYISERVPDLRVVWMNRSKEEVIRSFMEWDSNGYLRPRDKIAVEGKLAKQRKHLPFVFPLIDAANTDQAIGFYWEMYQEKMLDVTVPKHPMLMTDLNDDDRLIQLFDFLEIPLDSRVFPKKRKYNTLADAQAKLRQAVAV